MNSSNAGVPVLTKGLEVILEKSFDVVSILDGNGVIRYQSRSSQLVFGLLPEEVVGTKAHDRVHPEDRENLFNMFSRCVGEGREEISTEFRYRHKSGEWRYVEVLGRNMIEKEEVGGVVFNMRDVSRRRKAEVKATYYEYHDPMTGLPNRFMLKSRIQVEMRRAERTGDGIALLCVGIDKLKDINNIFSTRIGDMVLQNAAIKLSDAFRDGNFVCRLSGDKFVVLLTGSSAGDDLKVSIHRVLRLFSEAMIIERKVVKVSVSVGVCSFPEDGDNKDILLKNSETAMYEAKREGPGNYRCFEKEMNERMLCRIKREKDLQGAILRKEFFACYQPKVDSGGEVTGMESLIRWYSRESKKIIPPSDFIPLAERNGMIVDIGRFILFESCIQNRRWQEMGYRPKKVAVNISPVEFRQPDLTESVKYTIKEAGLDPKWLELELTESGIMDDDKESIEKLNELHRMGISLSIDDFGTGYSSLSKLKDYPIDVLKIDKSFVDNLPGDRKSVTIVRSIIDLAHNLGFKVVAEGVETVEQLNFLKAHSCEQFQGYYFSRPLDRDEFASRYFKKL